MARFYWTIFGLVVATAVVFAQQLEPNKADPYPGFRPCKVKYGEDGTKIIDETPFEAPPRLIDATTKAQIGCTYQWFLNEKTGEFLYRKIGNAKIGLFYRDPKTGELKELKGTDKP